MSVPGTVKLPDDVIAPELIVPVVIKFSEPKLIEPLESVIVIELLVI